jgi:hypothetical protein
MVASETFYEVAAQILPLFFVVLAIEARVLEWNPAVWKWQGLWALAVVGFVLFLALGEVLAISALALNDDSVLVANVVTYSLWFAGLAVIGSILGSPLTYLWRLMPARTRNVARLILGALLGAAPSLIRWVESGVVFFFD